jgi:hypothetical protein
MRRDKGVGIRRWRGTGIFLYELGGGGGDKGAGVRASEMGRR